MVTAGPPHPRHKNPNFDATDYPAAAVLYAVATRCPS